MHSVRRFELVARVLSVVGSPPLLAFPTAFLAGLRAGGYPSTTLSIIEFLILACVLPTLFTYALFRTGRTCTLDLQDRADRIIPSAVTALGCTAAWALMWRSAAPISISNLAIGLSAQMALLALLTMRWKVSYHAAAGIGLVLVSRSLGNSSLTLALLALALCVGWARIYQGRHTLVQLAVGACTTAPILLIT